MLKCIAGLMPWRRTLLQMITRRTGRDTTSARELHSYSNSFAHLSMIHAAYKDLLEHTTLHVFEQLAQPRHFTFPTNVIL